MDRSQRISDHPRDRLAIRTATAADITGIVPLLNAAYAPSPTFEERFRAYRALEPDGWVVAVDCGAYLGVGGFVSFGRCAYLGLIAVSPHVQRRGIGAAVVEELLRRCEARGNALLLLDASEPGAPLYEKYSFRDDGAALVFTVDPRAVTQPAGESAGIQVAPLDPGDARSALEIAELDARCFGAERSSLVRACLQTLPGRAFVARDSAGALTGYAVGQRRSLGPCMARSPVVAEALVRRAMGLRYEGPVTWIVADQNRDAVALARAIGGTPTGTRRHMRRGDPSLLASDWRTLFAKVSLAVG